jgi:hypothetical protein
MPKKLSAHFDEIFLELDNPDNYERFNMKSYNVRVTSLEEVFIKLGEEELANSMELKGEKIRENENTEFEGFNFDCKPLSAC